MPKIISETKWMNAAVSDDGDEVKIVIDDYIGWWSWRDGDDETVKAHTKQEMRKELTAISNMPKVKRIVIQVSSLGGSVDHALAIHDMIAAQRNSGVDVVTEITGMTASAGTIVPQAGATRKISENALGLIHNCLGGGWGNVHDLEEAIKTQKEVNECMAKLYAKRGGKTVEEIRAVMEEDNGNGRWLSPERMLELGLVDEVVPATELAACAAKDVTGLVAAARLPPVPEELIRTFPDSINNSMSADDSNGEKSKPKPRTQGNTMNKEEIAKLKNMIGAEAALDAVASGQTYEEAVIASAGKLSGDLAAARNTIQERDAKITDLEGQVAAKDTKISELEAKVSGQEDPLAPNAQAGDKAEADANAEAAKTEAAKKAEAEADEKILAAIDNGFKGE